LQAALAADRTVDDTGCHARIDLVPRQRYRGRAQITQELSIRTRRTDFETFEIGDGIDRILGDYIYRRLDVRLQPHQPLRAVGFFQYFVPTLLMKQLLQFGRVIGSAR